ncbi:MAG: FecR domain-containing protein [Chitinophagaceae bacterium]|nr:FecR domain-containing protein [Chitinophagaceae bacterium]MCW5929555.1 FecR domain-containing protein [Chitinophagaceae bacterium]
MSNERLPYLFRRYCAGTCSPEERKELALLCLLPKNQQALEKIMEATWERTPLENDMPAAEGNLILQNILHPPVEYLPPVRKFGWQRQVAAASIILAAGMLSYFFLTHKKEIPAEVVQTAVSNDITPPVANKAVITLADGSELYLDNAGSGQLAVQDNVKLVKLANGQIVYKPTGDNTISTHRYNTLSNPRGSKVVDMELADGSHVWLNAGSSIRYPIAFAGTEREVAITGEAYFEVAHNAAMPFKVINGKTEVTVLGTHFNVNAYTDEASTKVTLLEGAIKVNNFGAAKILRPGEQAQITDKIVVATNADIEEVMAWKTGKFIFGEKADIETVMRQVSRWYDVDIEYQGKITSHFGGTMSRQVNISGVLSILEATGHVKCRVEGKKVIITPYHTTLEKQTINGQ